MELNIFYYSKEEIIYDASSMRKLRREDLNLRMAESKSAALPLGDAPFEIKYMKIDQNCQS